MSYIIILQNGDDEQLQVFAIDELQMMGVLKKAITSNYIIGAVNAIDNIITGKDFLEGTETDLNFGTVEEE